MPLRPFSREQSWLLPPSLDEMVPDDHSARFVAAFVDSLDLHAWAELGIEVAGDPMGAPAYDPRCLLSVWVYGFVSGVRSSRKLEAACREQLPYLWLTGCQRPDHNTLWRFYEGHRAQMKGLLKRTVKTAVRLGLVDLAVQALDGSKIAGNAAKERSFDEAGLKKLLARTDEAIADLEAQNRTGGDPIPARLPRELKQARVLREQVEAALKQVGAEEGPRHINLTDAEAGLMKGRQGMVAGYNGQAVVSPLATDTAKGTGLLITAAEVVNEADDHAQAMPMLREAEEMTGRKAGVSLLDGGYHSGTNLEACKEEGYKVLMPEAQDRARQSPYHKDRFQYDAESNSYSCPQGQKLIYVGIKRRKGRPEARIYRCKGSLCRACPAFGQCTKGNHRRGREIEVSRYEGILREHRDLMARPDSKITYSRRKELVEPTFGILKELHGARRFLLRGLANVRAEWLLLATAFNLKTLFRVWRRTTIDLGLLVEATAS